jgi:PmbA protein
MPSPPALVPEQLIELAKKAGADNAEVYQSRTLTRPVFYEANRLKQIEIVEAEGTALRLWQDGRPGLAVGYGAVNPQQLVQRALALSQLNPPEQVEMSAGICEFYPNVGTAVSVETLTGWAQEAITLVRDRFPDTLCSADWECEAETTRLVNCRGLDCSYTDTTLSVYMAAEWIRGDDFLNVADGQTQRDLLDPKQLAEQLIQRLEWSRKGVSPLTGRIPVLFTAKAADMLWGTVQAALNSKQVAEKASPWSDRLGEMVLHHSITASQAPTEGPFSCPFDDEGTVTRPITFIDRGQLQIFYTDITTGRLLGSGTTGNGFRTNLSSYPTPGLVNFLIQPGSLDLAEMIQQLPEALVVDQILGSGAGMSGDFSINVDLGYRVYKGEVLGRVKDTMLAGNVYSALKQITHLGGDTAWNGSCFTPSLVVEGLSTIGRD